MTYQEFKKMNDSVKSAMKGQYQPVTVREVVTSPKGVGMDGVYLSTGQFVRMEGLINSIRYGMNCLTNPSKLTSWRGFNN